MRVIKMPEETVESLKAEVQRCQDEVKRANASLDHEIQAHTATRTEWDKAISELHTKHAKEIAAVREKYKKDLKRADDAHARALAKAVTEPPEVRTLRERKAKLVAEHAAAMASADAEFNAAMTK